MIKINSAIKDKIKTELFDHWIEYDHPLTLQNHPLTLRKNQLNDELLHVTAILLYVPWLYNVHM